MKQKEKLMQLIEDHAKELTREKDIVVDLLKNVSIILQEMPYL